MENLIEKLNRLTRQAEFIEKLAWDTQAKYDDATMENVVISKLYCEASYIKKRLADIVEQLKQEAANEEQAAAELAQELHDRESFETFTLEPEDELPF